MMLETGLLVTETPTGSPLTARHFLVLNRIIATLTLRVKMVQSAARSGSLITAREATECGGEVMAILRSPLDPRSSGCNILIRDGATLVQNSEDIIECLALPRSEVRIAGCGKVILEGLGTEQPAIDDLVR